MDVLDSQGYVPDGIGQYDKQRGVHQDGLPYLQRAPHATVEPTLFSSASIPEQSAIPPLQTPYYSPRSIEGSAFLAIEGIPDLASGFAPPDDVNYEEMGHIPFEEPQDTEQLQSAIQSSSVINAHQALRNTTSHVTPPSRSLTLNEFSPTSQIKGHPPLYLTAICSTVNPAVSAIDLTGTPHTAVTNHHEYPGSHPRSPYAPYHSSVSCDNGARVVSPNCHSRSPTFSSLPDMLPYNNPSAGITEPDNTNVGSISLLDSGRSTVIEEPVAEWWDQDCSSDSLLSSDEEDDSPCVGNGHESTYPAYSANIEYNDTSQHVDGFDDSSNEEIELIYGDDGASQHSEEFGVLPDGSTHLKLLEPEDDMLFFESGDALDPRYDEHEDPTLVDLEELGSEYDLDDGFGPPLEEEDEPDDTSDRASQQSEELGIPPDEAEHNFEDLYESDQPIGDDDGASQRSDEWGTFFGDEDNEAFENGDHYDHYENNVDRYEYGSDEGHYHHLVLVPQIFPRSLWSLQIAKSTHIRLPKLNDPSKPTRTWSVSSPLLETLASHVPFFEILPVFESFFHTASVVFLRNLQFSRHFTMPLEGTDVIVSYREHLLLPINPNESDLEFEEKEVTHDPMDDLFGDGSTPDYDGIHLISPTIHERQLDDMDGLSGQRNPVCPSFEEEESQYQSNERKTNGHFALVPQIFPSSLWSLQLPEKGSFDQLALPSSSITTFLSPHPIHFPVPVTLASLGHTLQLLGVAWTQSLPSFRREWVGMIDEEAVVNIASNQHPEWSSINGHSVPVYPPTNHDPSNGLETAGLCVHRNHHNLEPTTPPEFLHTQQSAVFVSRLFARLPDPVDMSVKLQLERL
ncbi:hypothetical protein PQX77_012469, partial [Marasmius sp. AFHP31]